VIISWVSTTAATATTTNTFSENGSFVVPAGGDEVTVECWGGGGGGGGTYTPGSDDGGGGGGGGGYARATFTLGVNRTITYSAGTGGAGGNDNDGNDNDGSGGNGLNSTADYTTGGVEVTANGGTGGLSQNFGGDGGSGGDGSVTGTVISSAEFPGGSGGSGNTSNGGGGGGGAGTIGPGGDGGNAGGLGGSGGPGNPGAGSGTGGTGSTNNAAGGTGGAYGGGGGGASDNGPSTGGPGAGGAVRFTYVCASLRLTSADGTQDQTINDSPMDDIVYTIAGTPTGASVAGLPAGVTWNFAGGVLTISGDPTETGTFSYTVTTSGGCMVLELDGVIEVNAVLPIQLLSFDARPTPQGVECYWTTAGELDNDYMAVERSTDGREFREIGRVPGRGTTDGTEEYSFLDIAPQPGRNFYRLRQVDFDGTVEYHRIVAIDYRPIAGLNVRAFPNPARDVLNLRWSAGRERPTTLRVFDLTGRQLALFTSAAGDTSYELPVDRLIPGVYLLQITTGSDSETLRFEKQ
jgi:hypothetical protein